MDRKLQVSARDSRRVIARITKLLLAGKNGEALALARVAVRRYPDDARIRARHGDALYKHERLRQAERAYRVALRLDGCLFQAWYGLAWTEFSRGAYASAAASFQRALDAHPKDGDARFYLAKCRFYLGEVDAAIEEHHRLAAQSRGKLQREALGEIAKIIPGSPTRGNAEILEARVRWAKLEAARERPLAKPRAHVTDGGKRLRIGYVSAFFASRNWMKPVWGVINNHDRSSFDVHLFADLEQPDQASGYARHRTDTIHRLDGLSNQAAAKSVRSAGIDILVDLNAYSFAERLGIFVRNPAPVRVGWFNSFATSGIRAFDYIVGDASVIARAEERYYAESVLRVPVSYLAFQVLYPVPEVTPPPSTNASGITFGCLAPQYKLTDEVISTWAEILATAPTSMLILKNTYLDERSNRAAVLARFERFGVHAERLILAPSADHYRFLKAYARIDIALDTFPYSGGTTTMEALWQGVPVLTFRGDRWASRTTVSLLRAAGLGDWEMRSREDYVKRAIELARSPNTPGMLATLRKGLRERLLASGACNSERLCRELEKHYKRIARRSKSGLAS
jgi:protein O-GlcNAc transferase